MSVANYFFHRALSRLSFDSNEYMCAFFRKKGCNVGEDVHIFSNIATSEAYLIAVGDGCTISADVKLLTHDASIGALVGRSVSSDICGKITIGSNTFIGTGSIILCGVTLGSNSIVAAGSVVTHSFPDGVIIGGNPAKVIGSTNEYIIRHQHQALDLYGKSKEERKKAIQSGIMVVK